MAFLATYQNGEEWIFSHIPQRCNDGTWEIANLYQMALPLPKGSIRKLIGRELTWTDEPVELKGEMI